jgi:hypothetical protein
MSQNRMILCSKLKNGLCKVVTKSQVATKFNVTKSRLDCNHFWLKNDCEKWSRLFFDFEIERAPSELLLPTAKTSAQIG